MDIFTYKLYIFLRTRFSWKYVVNTNNFTVYFTYSQVNPTIGSTLQASYDPNQITRSYDNDRQKINSYDLIALSQVYH
jgi:hypothetical protein